MERNTKRQSGGEKNRGTGRQTDRKADRGRENEMAA